MTNTSQGNAQGEAAALPEIHFDLRAMSLADLNALQIAVALTAAEKWRALGVELTQHSLPLVTMSGDNVAVQYLTTSSHINAVCHIVVELPSLPSVADKVSQRNIYRRGYDAVRKLFKGGNHG